MTTTISQRELRNDNAEVMRRVEAGERFVVTRNGKPVAHVIPIEDLPPDTRRMTVGEIDAEWRRFGPVDAAAWLSDIRDNPLLDSEPHTDGWTRS